MANYSLVVNSTFQPFTYQELSAPLDRQELYHEKLAEEYDKLSTQADVLEAMGKNDRNSGAYSRYKAYSDSLRKEADALYRFGLNTESRQRLSDLRRRYNTDIVPIQNAWTKREKEADDQMKASLANPSLMFTRDARNTSLDEYVANPTGGYGVINGANITAQMAGMAKNLEKEVRNGTIKRADIDPYLYDIIIEHGLDANTIRDWRNNPTLTAMFQQVMKANGVTPKALANSSNAQDILDKSASYAEMGMWSAIGERKDEFKENYGKRLEAQAEKEVDTYRKKKEVDAEQPGSGYGNSAINPLPLRSPQEISEKNKDIQDYINNGYVEQDPSTGQYKMTHKGFEEYRRNATPKVTTGASGGQTARVMNAETQLDNKERKFTPSKFRQFMDELNGGKSFMDSKGRVLPGWGPRRAGNLFASGIKRYEEGSYDTYHSTEYDRQVAGDYSTAYTNQLWTNAQKDKDGQYLTVVEFNGKNGWKETNEKIRLKDEGADDFKVTNIRYSKYGDTAILKSKNKIVRVKLPIINKTAYTDVRNALANADIYAKILEKGKRPLMLKDANGNTRLATNYKGEVIYTNDNLDERERQEWKKQHRKALTDMEFYGSQYVTPSKTETESYNRFPI